MTRTLPWTFGISAVALAAMWCAADATPASAQCCPTPTVAYSPVVVQPQTTVVRTGWYPGYLLDRLRLRRWTANTTVAAVPAMTTAPTYSVGYAPTYTAAYAPATYTASYTPYITAYAPLQTQVVQTSYAAPAVSTACPTCPQTTTVSYAPSTVYRPVELTPVVSTPACTCTVASPCDACAACPTVSQVSYVQGAAPADCPGCAAASGTPVYDYGTSSPSATPPAAPAEGSPQTPQPALKPEVATPPGSTYGEPTNGADAQSQEKSVMPGPAPEEETGPEADPAGNTDSSTYFEAPPLLGPQNDRTANRPTVDVHNAVYTRPARQASRVSTAAAKAAQAVDANGWYSVD